MWVGAEVRFSRIKKSFGNEKTIVLLSRDSLKITSLRKIVRLLIDGWG